MPTPYHAPLIYFKLPIDMHIHMFSLCTVHLYSGKDGENGDGGVGQPCNTQASFRHEHDSLETTSEDIVGTYT